VPQHFDKEFCGSETIMPRPPAVASWHISTGRQLADSLQALTWWNASKSAIQSRQASCLATSTLLNTSRTGRRDLYRMEHAWEGHKGGSTARASACYSHTAAARQLQACLQAAAAAAPHPTSTEPAGTLLLGAHQLLCAC
jgi:hypothetical protein